MGIDHTLDLIRLRAAVPSARTDQAHVLATEVLAPANPQLLAHVAIRLDVEIPEILRRLYTEIGNGGFGPGYGLLGLGGGYRDDLGQTADEVYASYRQRDPEDPAWSWPPALLPLCHWGCAIYSCIDLSTPDADVFNWDPTNHHPGTDPRQSMWSHGRSLLSWLTAWGQGANLWDEMFAPDDE